MVTTPALAASGPRGAAQQVGRPSVQRAEHLVETPDAAETRRHRDVHHREPGFVNELLGEQYAAGLRHRDRRCAQVLVEQTSELPLAEAQARGERVHAGVVQCAELDQRQRARHAVRRAVPGGQLRRRLGTAAQAGTEPRRLRGGGGPEEPHVLTLRRSRRADRTAVDPRRRHPAEEDAVEARVPRADRAVAGVGVEIHHCDRGPAAAACLAVFGHGRPRHFIRLTPTTCRIMPSLFVRR